MRFGGELHAFADLFGARRACEGRIAEFLQGGKKSLEALTKKAAGGRPDRQVQLESVTDENAFDEFMEYDSQTARFGRCSSDGRG
jgi:hypothetical protein